ncbi:Ti-type conjugative transfer relaxase TraA [Legionella pneumophila serogroup 1]|uniref:Ti-type conjugative transfer relaxase TraA n=1 Tax=Legionella pneumophila TaxID=446 RepID=UPI0015E8B2CB|nr:Ti-type conjugative transfer relaxase TraA [Legionella pneumophila]MCH9100158.1 Ti-type conjugative transfer relaxase TraA [Legionella pneumophila serogroup 1]MCH9112293.1 Ti-type conjugative transfer relaxase TraA [Legionella pneumophila serogroup 1]MDW9159423.1 Ti-type conjugative transfer relaxase TraA [Legionella pneumophila]HAT2009126.1 Ti-type conjugative transfer relaxase TraA [Legionella pneumophila]HCX3323977.1 Ti-type conjugative transfer relaxase TraA [Legionella pneumophila]
MAIAFAQVSIHSRSKGHSAVAAAAYRSGAQLYDDRIGRTYDFSKRDDVAFSEILLPDGATDSFLERDYLWNEVERAENRSNSQLCKDFVLALPRELDLVQQIELAKRFARTHFVEKGLPADISIHDHGDGNPHAHILIPTRRLEKNRFSKYKARDLNPVFAKGFVVEQDYWGEQWREMQNEFFIESNLDLQVDANHLISERHRGKHHNANAHYLLEENQLIQQARMELTRDNIDLVIDHLSSQYSVFSRRDVERLLFKTFKPSDSPQEYLQFVERVLGHHNVVALGENTRRQPNFTTRTHFLQEAQLLNDIEAMMVSKKHVVYQSIDRLAQQYQLSKEQQEAFRYIAQSSDISVVIGRPGTGKSYLLKPVNEYYTQAGMEVIGAALSGKVAKALQAETGITSSTIKSLSYRLANNMMQLSDKHVLIIDETGMVDFASLAYLIKEAHKAGSKVVLIGDPDQLKPIQKGEIFRGIAARTGYIELENIKRQQDLGDRQASLDLAKGDIEKAIQHYQNKGAITIADTRVQALEKVVADWKQDLESTSMADNLMLSYTRKAVNHLNDLAREALIAENKIGDENIVYQGLERNLKISTGERLLFRENNKVLGVRNGDTATVKEINAQQMKIQLDSGEFLTIPKEYKALDYAYALTVHKSQGMTAKKVRVLIDSKYWDRNLSFVAMTRHKEQLDIYADKENHSTEQTLKQTLSRSSTKDNVIDWPLDFATRSGFDSDSLIGKAVNHITGLGYKIKQAYNFIVNYEAYLLKAGQQDKLKDIGQDRIYAKQEALRVDTKVAESKDYKISDQAFEILKKDFPQLGELETLIKKRQRMTGYFAEKADKQITAMSQQLLTNKNIANQVKNQVPEFYHKIQSIYNKQKEKDLYQDH